MIQKTLLISCLIFAASAKANSNAPSYFNKDIDSEYRLLIKHVRNMLPKSDLPLAYLPSFYPFSLLDVRPTKFKKDEDKQAFANFNFGVFGSSLLNINKNELSKLPNISICKKRKCQEQRIDLIEQFLENSSNEIEILTKNNNLSIVQQTAPHVYRINNTFFSPNQLITYYPSEYAGFVPSGDYKLSKPDETPTMVKLSDSTQSLREKMAEYNVAAITKVNDKSINIIFGGFGDNHWGIIINHDSNIPTSGEHNNIGLEYDIVQKISENSFYYQTN